MEENATNGKHTLAEQLAHYEATGELLPEANLLEGLVRVDCYLRAVALARRRANQESSLASKFGLVQTWGTG
jgi:hypothetical protein